MFRPVWSGSIRLGPMQIAVMAYTAVDTRKAGISLNQLHAGCHDRIRIKKICPIHGELGADEIVMGYASSPGQFIVLDPSEIDELRPTIDDTIDIHRFVSPRTIDPSYFSGKSYYLVPGGSANWSYRVLHQAMLDEDVCGLTEVTIRHKEHLVVVSPVERLLSMSVLHYPKAIRLAALFDTDLKAGPISGQQLSQAKSLIRARQIDHAHLEEYRDPYQERLAALIARKSANGDIGKPAETPQQLTGKVIKTRTSEPKRRASRQAMGVVANGERILSQRPLPRRNSG